MFISSTAMHFLMVFQVFASLYQYTDANGTQQVVSDPSLIPARFLRDAKRIDDDGAVLGNVQAPGGQTAAPRDDRHDLERIKNSKVGGGIHQKSDDQLLHEILDDGVSTAKSVGSTLRNADVNRPNTWITLAVALVLGIIALRFVTGLLRLAALLAALFAGALFVGEHFGDTPVGASVKKATDSLVKPVKKMQAQTGDKIAAPLKAPYEAMDKVKKAVESHKKAAEERNEILEQLTGD